MTFSAWATGGNRARRAHPAVRGSPKETETIEVDPYGDFSLNRWLWVLADVEVLDPYVLAKGRQRLWECPYLDDSDEAEAWLDGFRKGIV